MADRVVSINSKWKCRKMLVVYNFILLLYGSKAAKPERSNCLHGKMDLELTTMT